MHASITFLHKDYWLSFTVPATTTGATPWTRESIFVQKLHNTKIRILYELNLSGYQKKKILSFHFLKDFLTPAVCCYDCRTRAPVYYRTTTGLIASNFVVNERLITFFVQSMFFSWPFERSKTSNEPIELSLNGSSTFKWCYSCKFVLLVLQFTRVGLKYKHSGQKVIAH